MYDEADYYEDCAIDTRTTEPGTKTMLLIYQGIYK